LRKLIIVFTLLTIALMMSPAPSAADPVCPEGWYAVDAQSWWQDAPGPFSDMTAGHLHLGGCIPLRTTHLTGTVPFDAIVKMHNNDGKVTYVAIVVKTDSLEQTYRSVNPGWTCPTADCTFVQHFDLPVSAFNVSGRQEIRLRVTAKRPNGKEFRTSLNFEAVIDNGKTLNNFDRMPYTRGKGWYTNVNYCEASYRDDITPVPVAPVSGTWTPYITQVDHGSSDANPTYWSIRVDPDIHAGYMGLFLGEGAGSRNGYFPIDTTQLANGPHKLFLQTKCEVPAGQNVGVLVIPFTVAN